jgi:peptidyl-prolyl cis-trans isomerase C
MKDFYEKEKESFNEPEKVTASHILFKVDEDADADAKDAKRKAAEAAREKLVKGADFAQLAKEMSDCPSSKQGGNLGSFARGQMVKPFEDAAFSQDVDAIGPVVETKFGYHIIKVTDHSKAEQKTFEDVKDDIESKLEDQKRRELVQAYVAKLEDEADITYPE